MMFNIDWKGVLNTFEKGNELVYTLKRDGIALGTYSAPTSDTSLIGKVVIPANTTYTYELEFHFVNLDVNQDYNRGKTFSAGFKIDVYNPSMSSSMNK